MKSDLMLGLLFLAALIMASLAVAWLASGRALCWVLRIPVGNGA